MSVLGMWGIWYILYKTYAKVCLNECMYIIYYAYTSNHTISNGTQDLNVMYCMFCVDDIITLAAMYNNDVFICVRYVEIAIICYTDTLNMLTPTEAWLEVRNTYPTDQQHMLQLVTCNIYGVHIFA
jgi:hypothetical protein